MQENNKEIENEILNGQSQPDVEYNSINNFPNNVNKNNNELDNSSTQILNPKEEEKKQIKNEDNIIIIDENIKINNNNQINNSIKNNNNIKNDNSLFDIPPLIKKQFNFNNLSREEKIEQIENFLHSLLSEASSLKEKGNELYKNNIFEEAEKKYREGINKLNETSLIPELDELNGQINNYLINITTLTTQLYNNLTAALFKQEKYEETIKNCEFIIQNLNNDHVLSYCRILFCLIKLKKVVMANHYADIIKIKFGKQNCFSKFKDNLKKLENLNMEFSEKILNQNPALKKEVMSINDDLKAKNEIKLEEEQFLIGNYLPYIIGGAAILFAGASFLYKNLKK